MTPNRPDAPRSARSARTKPKLMPAPEKSAPATEAQMEKTVMTTTSMTMVTLRAVWVKRPLARISAMTAIADEGERATRIVPARMATAMRPAVPSSFMKGMYGDNRKTAMLPRVKVATTRPKVIQVMLLSRLRSSLRRSSQPAAKAM